MKTYIATLNPINIKDDEFTKDHFKNRMESLKRIETILEGKVSNEAFLRFQKHLKLLRSLSEEMRKEIFTHTTFYYWCYRLFELYSQGNRSSLEAWIFQLNRFGIVEALKEGILLRSLEVPIQNGQLNFPNLPFHIELDEQVDNCEYASLTVEKNNLKINIGTQSIKIPLIVILDKIPHEKVRQHTVLHEIGTQISGGEPFLKEYLNVWNENFSPESKISLFETISEIKKKHIEECLTLLNQTWPEFTTEFQGHVQLIVPFVGGERHAFTTTVWPGAIFISDNFGKKIFTIERLVHEASHLRLNAIMSKDPLHLYGPEYTVPSPFREGPRPVIGLYHGIFVFTRVAQAMVKIYKNTGEELYAQRIPFLVSQVNEAIQTFKTHDLKLTLIGKSLLEEITVENKRIERICNEWSVKPLSKEELVKLGFDSND